MVSLKHTAFDKGIVYTFVFIVALFIPVFSHAALTEVGEISHWSSPDYTRVVINLGSQVGYTKNRLSKPDRLYFDLSRSSISKEIKTTLPVEDGILKTIRASQFTDETVRVVLDIDQISDYRCFLLEDPARLVIDVYGRTGKTHNFEPQDTKRRIVIDAGHGGHDPGAIGPNNLYEKDVVLDVALRLKRLLMEDRLNEVFLTRDSDRFIPLEERTAIANRKKADLFVSIHANASPKRNARGVETYLLNWTDDESANRVAARENAISMKKMRALKKQMDIVEMIKNDLVRANKRDESVNLANYVHRSLVSTLGNRERQVFDLGVKQAAFYVLFGARMPSILAEVSFISNPEEENLLSQDSYREEIAKGLAKGISQYFKSAPVMQQTAGVSESFFLR